MTEGDSAAPVWVNYTVQRWQWPDSPRHPQTIAAVALLFGVDPRVIYDANRGHIAFYAYPGHAPEESPFNHPLMAGCVLRIPVPDRKDSDNGK